MTPTPEIDLDRLDPAARARIEADMVMLAAQRDERERLEAATRDAHAAAVELKQAVKDAKEEIRQNARGEARKHLARALGHAAEQLRLSG